MRTFLFLFRAPIQDQGSPCVASTQQGLANAIELPAGWSIVNTSRLPIGNFVGNWGADCLVYMADPGAPTSSWEQRDIGAVSIAQQCSSTGGYSEEITNQWKVAIRRVSGKYYVEIKDGSGYESSTRFKILIRRPVEPLFR